MTTPTEPLKVTLEESLKLLAERRDGRRISYEVDTPDGEPCWVAWERYVTLGPADSWEGALAIALEQPVVARDEAAELRAENAELRAALRELISRTVILRSIQSSLQIAGVLKRRPDSEPDLTGQALSRARAALAASEGQP